MMVILGEKGLATVRGMKGRGAWKADDAQFVKLHQALNFYFVHFSVCIL